MLHLNLQISNPWSNFFKTGYVWAGKLIGHKYWELQAMRTHDLLCVRLNVSHRRDHAGLDFEIGLFSFNIAFRIYDHRHWDHITNRWEVYDCKDDEV